MKVDIETRFQDALADLVDNRSIETEEARTATVNSLADLILEAARTGDGHVPTHCNELMLALLPRVPPRIREGISRRLAACRAVSPEIARMIAEDDDDIAAPMLRQSAVYVRAQLFEIATGDSDEKARAVASRADLDPDIVSVLIDRQDPVIGASLALSQAASIDEAMAERIASIPNLPRVAARRLIDLAALSDGALAQLFWQVESDARRRIADRISTRTGEKQKAKKQTGDSEPSQVTLQLADALFALAAAGDRAEIATRLADALSLPRTVATRIIGDLQGEALTIALRAAGIPSDRTTGIILLTVSEAGRSYETLRTLVGLAEDVNPEAAWHVVGLWARAADRSHAARHVPTVARPNMRAGRAGETKIRRLEDLANALGRRTAS